jgi:beta-glucosidase
LLTDVLRKQWGFKGILMSDWGAVHELLGPITAGTDLEMGFGKYYTPASIKQGLAEGKITQDQIDEHVRRILRVSAAMGFLDNDQEDKSIPLNDPSSAATALRVAREGIVLLKNDRGLLPVDRHQAHSIVVLGPNAVPAIIGGGGSSYTDPFASLSLLDAVTTAAGNNVKVTFIPNWIGANPTSDIAFDAGTEFEPIGTDGDRDRAMKAEYFSTTDLSGKPIVTRNDSHINFKWDSQWRPVEQITSSTFSVRWTGKIKAPQTDTYVFSCVSDGARILLDGKPFMDVSGTGTKSVKIQAGETHDLVVEYRHLSGPSTIQFTWGKEQNSLTNEEAKQIAKADLVVASVGFNPSLEREGSDRSYDLPTEQTDLLRRIRHLNPRVLVVLNGGGNVGMDKWIDGVYGLMHAWYPGQNGNTAVAEAIFGDLNPSGRLPDTFEKKWEDSPASGNFPGTADNGGRVDYKEGIYVGYRWFDKQNIAPRYPFGYGLSYTTFSMHDLKLNKQDAKIDATVEVSNTGKRTGAEVVQLYVRPINSSLDRPVQELKGFARVELKPGETKTVSIPLNADSFATYDDKAHAWITPHGHYEIAVGASSRDIHCSQATTW